MSQFRPSQHFSDSDVQIWKQQMLYKKLQEFQRQQQQQQQQLDHGARMQNSFGQYHAPAKQSPADQFPTMMNGIPMNGPSSYAWLNNISVGGSRLGSNSQILNNGNPHWEQNVGPSSTGNFVNGAVYPNIQNLMGPMGSVSNKVNQSFHSTPASMSNGSGNLYSQFLGFPVNSQNVNAMARAGSDQSDKAAMFGGSINSFQNEHGLCQQYTPNNLQNFRENESVLSDSSTQSQGGNLKTGSPVLVTHLQPGFHLHDNNGSINQVECLSVPHVGQTSSAASLDPAEEKILYGDDNNFTGLLGDDDSSGGVLGHDNSSGNGNSRNAQGGSWSALMQEALQSTSSKNGLQEEWSGMNLQNTDQAFTNNLTFPGLEQRQHSSLNRMNLRSASSSSQPSPSHDGSSGTMNNPKFNSFQHAMKSTCDQQEKFSYGSTSTAINSHTTVEANDGFLQPSLKQSHSGDYGSPEQANLSNGNWPQQKPGLLKGNLNSGGEHFMPQHTRGLEVLQQNSYKHCFNGESSNNQSDWNSQNSHGQDISNSDRSLWKSEINTYSSFNKFQQSNPDVTVQVPNDCYSSKNTVSTSSSTPMFSPGQHEMMLCKSGESFRNNYTPGLRPPPATSGFQGNNVGQGLADFSQMYINANSAEGHDSNNRQHLGNSFSTRENSFSGMDAHTLGQSEKKTIGPSALLNHRSATTGISTGQIPTNSLSNTKFLSQSIEPPKNQENLLGGICQVSSNTCSTNEKIAMVEEQLTQHAMANKYSNEFRGYDSTLSQSPNKVVQTSQRMLQQFLQKVDNSNSAVVGDMPTRSVDTTAHQLNQPPLQGFGLKLPPPKQQQPTSGNLWTSHTVDIKQADNSVPEKDQQQLPSAPAPTSSSSYPSRSSPFYSSDADNTGLSSGSLSQIKSLGQQYPFAEPKSSPVNSLSQQSLQGTTATIFKNVWTNISAQRLGGIQQNKITPNILQSMMFPSTVGDSTLRGSPKDDYQTRRIENLSDTATVTTNPEIQAIKQVVENDARSISSNMSNVDNMGDILSGKKNALQRPFMQQDIINSSQGENMAENFPHMSSSFKNVSTCGGISLHGSLIPSNSLQINYSLLHQMRAMKPVYSDPQNTYGKRLKTTDVSCDASQVEWTTAQRAPYGENNSVRSCTDSEAPGVSNSLPSDQMFRVPHQNSEEIPSTMPFQVHLRELPSTSNDMTTVQTDLQNQCSSLGASSTDNLNECSERLRINPHISSWFQQGSYRNGQNLAMYSASARNTETSYNCPKDPRAMDNSSVAGHDYSTSVGPEMPSGLKVCSAVGRPKKRKFEAPVLVSWNRIIEGHQKLAYMSALGMDWPEATNTLMEKVEDEAGIQEDAPILYLARKRLILTSRLIQQLLPAIPATILRAQAISMYQSATYTIAKLTIGDACSMASNSFLGTGTLISSDDKSSEQTGNNEMRDGLMKAMELLIARFTNMENDFVSLNKRSSMLDVQLDCQDLERMSIVNRLGRFHGRIHHTAGVEASSTDLAPRRIYPDRHVMSFAVPGNLPEGVPCLLL